MNRSTPDPSVHIEVTRAAAIAGGAALVAGLIRSAQDTPVEDPPRRPTHVAGGVWGGG